MDIKRADLLQARWVFSRPGESHLCRRLADPLKALSRNRQGLYVFKEPLGPRPATIYLQLIWRKHRFHDNTRGGLLFKSPVMYGGRLVRGGGGQGGRELLHSHIIPPQSLSQLEGAELQVVCSRKSPTTCQHNKKKKKKKVFCNGCYGQTRVSTELLTLRCPCDVLVHDSPW